MRQTFLEKQAGHLYVILFQQNNFGHIRNLCLPQNEKQGFIFFAHLKKKKTEQNNYTMLSKISNLILNRFQIPSESDPPTQSLPKMRKGGRVLIMGKGGPFRTTSF